MNVKNKFIVLAGMSVLCFGLIGAQTIEQAPTGFDGLTNGSVDQPTMDAASETFQEVEAAVPNGLGPTYNETSCAHCHFNQAIGGASQVMVLRAGHYDRTRPAWFRDFKNRFDTTGSSGTFVAATAVTSNGTPIPNRSLINQRAICTDAQEHLTDTDNIRSMRLSLPIFGDGFVEATPDSTFLALAAKNGGEAIQVPISESNGATAVGKFGLKDQHASLLSFASDAYLNEMGVTNLYNPDEVTEVCNPSSVPEPNDATSPSESVADITTFTTFMRALKAPPRGLITSEVSQGETIFDNLGCATCHVSTMTTAPAGTTILGGTYTISAAVGGKTFHPYGDFLLHNLGECEGIVQNGPPDTGCKVRTMPLWGVRTRTQLMHDAQSPTYAEAITRHGGEAVVSQFKFDTLAAGQKQLLYDFLGSL